MLRGKRKPEYTPHCDTGDFVVVINAEKIAVTGKKRTDKIYYRHSGYPGGLRSRTLNEMLERRPEEVIRKAVNGMLPRNRLARAADPEAQDLRRARSSPRRPEAEADRDRDLMTEETPDEQTPPEDETTEAPAEEPAAQERAPNSRTRGQTPKRRQRARRFPKH